ncbi:MAG: hypothetical protein IT560_01920, partial [Alphaproteobacteria bacterium]|nr:hypothetical protein [Alphaproteobacteria bacterium]
MLKPILRTFIAATIVSASLTACTTDSSTASYAPPPPDNRTASRPALQTTDAPAPDVIYRRGSRDTVLTEDNATKFSPVPYYHSGVETLVSRKVNDLN